MTDIAAAHKAADYLRELYTNNPETRAKIDECAAIIVHQAIAYERWEIANSRIRELEAERDAALSELDAIAAALGMQDTDDDMAAEIASLKIAENHHHEEFARVETERDAIRAKTFEECAQLVWEFGEVRIAEVIRALAQSERGEGKIEADKDLPTAEDVRGILRPETGE